MQHIVPRTYLKRFAFTNGKTPFVYAYDKNQKKLWKTKINQVAGRKDFYKLIGLKNENAWEQSLSRVEEK